MTTIAVLSAEQQIQDAVRLAVDSLSTEFEAEIVDTWDGVERHVNYDFPEVTLVYTADPVLPAAGVLDRMRSDPWLHFGGIIVVYDRDDEDGLAGLTRGLNGLASIRLSQLADYLVRVLRIMQANRNIVYNRDLHHLLSRRLSGSFVLDNDPFDLNTYSNLLANFMLNANLISRERRDRFHVAFTELLVNAVEHGNCGISYEEKTQHLASGGDPVALIDERNKDPDIARRKIYLSYHIGAERSTFTIRDEGSGFPWREYEAARGSAGILESHGRGILMAKAYLSELRYNDTGNEVTVELDHETKTSDTVPKVFANRHEVEIADGQVIFEQGEKSSELYYIVSGSYSVRVDGTEVAKLRPSDVFVGEMSFLLNNRRSATVIADGPGTLLRIDKEEFVNAIRRHPHYGIFLARLLAQRLVDLHHQSG